MLTHKRMIQIKKTLIMFSPITRKSSLKRSNSMSMIETPENQIITKTGVGDIVKMLEKTIGVNKKIAK